LAVVNLPPGGEIYDGADYWVRPGRDGALYVVYCGVRPKTFSNPEFGPQAYRLLPDGRVEWINFAKPPREGIRPSVIEYPDRAEVTWPLKGGRAFDRVPLPGYVPATFGGTVVAPVPVQPLPQPTPGGPAVDEEARQYTTAVKKELKADVAALDKRLGALEARPTTSVAGISRDESWQLARDSVYFDVQRPDSGIRAEIAKLIDARPAPTDRNGLKALVREVLLELLAD